MTIFGPDGSAAQAGIKAAEADWDAIGFLAWRASIGKTVDQSFDGVRTEAMRRGKPFVAYTFPLPVGAQYGTAVDQAAVFHWAVHDLTIPVMIDWEHSQSRGVDVPWSSALAVADAIRDIGYRITLQYSPRWYWSTHGTPDLREMQADLVSSAYDDTLSGDRAAIYAHMNGDTGKGWPGYGGLDPVIWQYTSKATWGGKPMDCNAYRGPAADLARWFWTPTPEVPPVTLINTVPTHSPVLPSATRGQLNGSLDPELLRDFDGRGKLLTIVSYGMQALHLAAWNDQIPGFAPIDTETVGRYRTYDQQVNLVHQRMSMTPRAGATTRTVPAHVYKGVAYPAAVWYLLPGMAQVATPRTSNHGWGSADDVAEERTGDHVADGMSEHQLTWMRDNAGDFGFGLESRKERWHWCWIAGDQLPQRAVEVLRACGIPIDLPGFDEGQAPTPAPDPQLPSVQEDDMAILVKGSGPTYYAWNGVTLTGVPNERIIARGVARGIYPSDDPEVWADGDIADLLTQQAER